MSRVQPSLESDCVDQTNSESLLRRDVSAERADFDSLRLSGITLQDLPIELLECILANVVAMEVKDLKLAKIVWKEHCDVVIRRLQPVCLQWSRILETKSFEAELHRTLDCMAQKTIGLEIVHQSRFQKDIANVTTLKDEIFMHALMESEVIVYDRYNTAAVKDVIPLSGLETMDIVACIVNNCVYVIGYVEGGYLDDEGFPNTSSPGLSVLRITKVEEHQFNVRPWISDIRVGSFLSTTASGHLLIVSNERGPDQPACVGIYNANGTLEERIPLSSGIFSATAGVAVLEKSNGNLVLASHKYGLDRWENEMLLTEIDRRGSIIHQYKSKLRFCQGAFSFADVHGRIMISDPPNKIEMLDSELNFLNLIDVQMNDDGECTKFHLLHYDGERNEVVGVYPYGHKNVLAVFLRLTEE